MFVSKRLYWLILPFIFLLSCARYDYDIIIENGTVYDGSGSPGLITDLAIKKRYHRIHRSDRPRTNGPDTN